MTVLSLLLYNDDLEKERDGSGSTKIKLRKEIFNNSSNYVYFKKKNGKASLVVFGMENYVG